MMKMTIFYENGLITLMIIEYLDTLFSLLFETNQNVCSDTQAVENNFPLKFIYGIVKILKFSDILFEKTKISFSFSRELER